MSEWQFILGTISKRSIEQMQHSYHITEVHTHTHTELNILHTLAMVMHYNDFLTLTVFRL